MLLGPHLCCMVMLFLYQTARVVQNPKIAQGPWKNLAPREEPNDASESKGNNASKMFAPTRYYTVIAAPTHVGPRWRDGLPTARKLMLSSALRLLVRLRDDLKGSGGIWEWALVGMDHASNVHVLLPDINRPSSRPETKHTLGCGIAHAQQISDHLRWLGCATFLLGKFGPPRWRERLARCTCRSRAS